MVDTLTPAATTKAEIDRAYKAWLREWREKGNTIPPWSHLQVFAAGWKARGTADG